MRSISSYFCVQKYSLLVIFFIVSLIFTQFAVGETSQNITSSEVSAKEPWVDNNYGSEDVVLPGLEPLKADSNSVVMWGREYRFDGQTMPMQITNQGNKMLVRPINWFLKVGSDTFSLIPKSSKLISSSPTRAVYETEGVLGEVKVHGRVMVEYDGFMKFDLEFIPSKPVSIDQLYMDIPFAPSIATNFFYPTRRSGVWEKDWHSPLTLVYTNIITIGTPDICLQWLTESDQYYYPRGSENVLQTIEDAGASVFRTNVIGSTKEINSPFKLTFALQAGPVKARPANWRAWTMSPACFNLNTKLYNDVRYCYDWWARGPGELIPRKGFPDSCDPNLFKDQIQVASAHFAGFRSYDEPNSTERTPEWKLHENEWIRIPRMPDEGTDAPGWINTYIDTNSSWSQWHVYNAYKLFSLTGMRGLYYDDWRNGSSTNEAAGSGYIDEQGIRQPTNPIFSQREVHRRIYAIVKKFRPDDGVVIIHTASTVMLPVVSFCDVIYDGEVMLWTDLIPPGGDYFKTFRNDLFQAMFTCKQYGPIPGFHDMTMQYARSFHDKVGGDLLFVPNQRKLWAILLTHDIHMHAAFASGAEQMLSIWMDSFGIADPAIKFHAYWDPNSAAKVLGGYLPDGTKVNDSHRFWASAYSKPDKVLVVVVRDSPSNDCSPIEVKVKLDRKKLGLPDGQLSCTNFESLGRSPLGKVDGDILTVEVLPMATSVSCTFAGVIIQPVQ